MTNTTDTPTAPLSTCWACDGTGTDWGQTCNICSGSGVAPAYAESIVPTNARIERAAARMGGTTTGRRSTRSTSPSGTVRFSKVNGEWGVAGPADVIVEGAEVTVTKRSGDTSTVTVGRIVEVANQYGDTVALIARPERTAPTAAPARSNRYDARCADCGSNVPAGTGLLTNEGGRWVTRHDPATTACDTVVATPAAPATVEAEAGRVYVTTDGRIVRVQRTRDGQRVYGKVWTADGWEYDRGVLRTLDHLITADEAAEWGHAHDHCVFCARALTTPESTEVGYGPVCAANNDLPWGGRTATPDKDGEDQ